MTPAVVVWWAPRLPLAELDLAPLSAEERARVERLGTSPAKERSAMARVLLRAALADALGAPAASFTIDWSRGPLLKDRGGPELSLTHSDDRIVVALSAAGRVGVDIETAARGERLRPTVVERITTTAERAALAALEPPVRERAAIQLWTAKEAILKANRLGLEVEPHTLEFAGLPEPTQLVAHARHPELVGASQLGVLRHDPDYVGTVALLRAAPAIELDERDAAQLLS